MRLHNYGTNIYRWACGPESIRTITIVQCMHILRPNGWLRMLVTNMYVYSAQHIITIDARAASCGANAKLPLVDATWVLIVARGAAKCCKGGANTKQHTPIVGISMTVANNVAPPTTSTLVVPALASRHCPAAALARPMLLPY